MAKNEALAPDKFAGEPSDQAPGTKIDLEGESYIVLGNRKLFNLTRSRLGTRKQQQDFIDSIRRLGK